MASYCHYHDSVCHHHCAANIITPYKLITAGHCLGNFNSSFRIVVGVSDIYKFADASRQMLSIKSVTIHPDYNNSTGYFDVGIITLETGLSLNRGKVWPISIGTEPLEFGQNVTLVANGKFNKYTKNQGGLLRYFPVQILQSQDCSQDIRKAKSKFPSNDSHGILCAKAWKPASSCTGDSGGGLVLQEKLRALVHGRRKGSKCEIVDYPIIVTDLNHPDIRAFLEQELAEEAASKIIIIGLFLIIFALFLICCTICVAIAFVIQKKCSQIN